ncbi:TSUP family transporter [Lactobacillus gasseri]|uniref:TSUP family transporter n=1 Tax=Lactobacillus gasseri TaxID=1596 RepID=UPI0022E491A0|nr:TSUP family transporter [Lactobacillus gasseri]
MNNIKENIVLAFFVDLFLGAISIFLAIGGGPLNVSLFVIIFHFTMKQSSVYSIATIFFSQITKIISIVASAQYQMFDMKMIPMLIILQLLAVILVQFGTRKFHQQNWKVFIQFS